jgi:hypothetical protein
MVRFLLAFVALIACIAPVRSQDAPPADPIVRRFGTVDNYLGPNTGLAFSPDGTMLAIATGKIVELRDTRTWDKICSLPQKERVYGMTFSRDGKELVVGGQGKQKDIPVSNAKGDGYLPTWPDGVVFWNIAERKVGRTLDMMSMGKLTFSGDGKLFSDGQELWDFDKKRRVEWYQMGVKLGGNVSSSAISFDGRLFALADFSGSMQIVDLVAGKSHPIAAKPTNCPFVGFSPDGKLLATCGGDALRLWDVAAKKEVKKFGSAASAVFAAGAPLLAWIGYDGAHLVDLVTWKQSEALSGHQDGVEYLALSPDGKLLATGGADGTVVVWDTKAAFSASPRPAGLLVLPGRETRVPAGAKVTLELTQTEYMLGEPIDVKFVVENVGKGIFPIEHGGDYRGASRHLRFHVAAYDEQGKLVEDPDPSGFCMGGMGGGHSLTPGGKQSFDVPVLAYRAFEKPGVYRLEISHDLGWSAAKDRPHPVAMATISLVAPTPEKARALLAKLLKEKESRDVVHLRDPSYLPLLVEAAKKGNTSAILGIGSIRTPEATAALIQLAQGADDAGAVRVIQTLNERLPDPLLDGALGGRNAFDNNREAQRRELVKRAWDPKFADDVRGLARRMLAKNETTRMQCGGYILQCLGTKEDLPILQSALDAAVAATVNAPLETNYPRPRGSCMELTRAAKMLIQRGAVIDPQPKSPGAAVLFLTTLGSDKTYRPNGWAATVVHLMKHEIAYVRETALVNLPEVVPDRVIAALPAVLLDRDAGVQSAACRWVKKGANPKLIPPLVECFAATRNEHVLSASSTALWALHADDLAIKTLVDRLDDPAMTSRCLSLLAGWTIADAGSSSMPGEGRFSAEQAKALKKHWHTFLIEHGVDFRDRNALRVGDPAIAGLFPECQFRATDRFELK